jgi:hypothetical protein
VEDHGDILTRFNRLMRELEDGHLSRNTFRAWEVELLIDLEGCRIDSAVRKKTLERYRTAVRKHIERGATLPLKLSEYLANSRRKSAACAILEVQESPGGHDGLRKSLGAARTG